MVAILVNRASLVYAAASAEAMPIETLCQFHVFMDMRCTGKHGHADVAMAHDDVKGHLLAKNASNASRG